MLQKEDFDKKEFGFAKSMILSKNRENLNNRRRKFDVCAPKHFFLNDIQTKAFDNTNVKNSKEILSVIMKKKLKEKLQEKIQKKKELDDQEKKFLESEGIANSEQKKLAEIIRKHRLVFSLEKYTKTREKEKEMRTKNQLKREEIKKKQQVKNQEMGILEGGSPVADNAVYEDKLKKSLQQQTHNKCSTRFSNQSHQTIKVMNMIKAKVEEDLQREEEEMEVLSPSSPFRRKMNEFRKSQTFIRQK